MKIIGLSGVAGSGKDLFYDLLASQASCKRFSLADALKSEISPYIKEHFGIDPVSCTRDDKNLIRPALVAHGSLKRKQTNGRYWIEKLQPKMEKFTFEATTSGTTPDFLVITDIRYAEYPKDESIWLKKEMNGTLIHISNFSMSRRLQCFVQPANEEEAREDPKLQQEADYLVEWEMMNGDPAEIKKTLIRDVVEDFLNWQKND